MCVIFKGKIILVGEWSHVSVAVDWIKEKLELKQPSGVVRPKSSEGRRKAVNSEVLGGTSGSRPRMMLVMDPYRYVSNN